MTTLGESLNVDEERTILVEAAAERKYITTHWISETQWWIGVAVASVVSVAIGYKYAPQLLKGRFWPFQSGPEAPGGIMVPPEPPTPPEAAGAVSVLIDTVVERGKKMTESITTSILPGATGKTEPPIVTPATPTTS